ncbi:MAG: hypothetical protein M3Q97_03895 [Bacteroidota bacterium]|nr:hypothetical protein [Bacteroidota bacterium]
MKKKKDPSPCTYTRFILYLYLSAAYADYRIEEDEYFLIKEKLERYKLIDMEEFESVYREVLHEFQGHNDFESMQYVRRCEKSLNMDKPALRKIFTDLKDITQADDVVEDTEKMGLFRLKKVMGL